MESIQQKDGEKKKRWFTRKKAIILGLVAFVCIGSGVAVIGRVGKRADAQAVQNYHENTGIFLHDLFHSLSERFLFHTAEKA